MFRLNRSTYRYRPKFPSLRQRMMEQAIVEFSEEHPELGADKIGAMVRRERHRVSNDRVQQVRREEGLQVRGKNNQCRVSVREGRRRRCQGASGTFHTRRRRLRNHLPEFDRPR